MTIAILSERQKSTCTNSSVLESSAKTYETRCEWPKTEAVRDEVEGDEPKSVVHKLIKERCWLVADLQERRKFCKKLWHLFRTDEEKFRNEADISNVPDSTSDPWEEEEEEEEEGIVEPGDNTSRPPCLQCSLKDGPLACSIQRSDDVFARAIKCQQCRRDGEAYCIRQHTELIFRPSPPFSSSFALDDRCCSLDLGRAEREENYLTDRVYSQNNILQRDQPRLRAVTLVLLRRYAYRLAPASAPPTGTMALPMWHSNDHPDNRRDPDYCPRSHADYFRERRAAMEWRIGGFRTETGKG